MTTGTRLAFKPPGMAHSRAGADQHYEKLKREWIARNPAATHEEYQQAMVRIAKMAGV